MSILTIHEDIIENPKLLTVEYFENARLIKTNDDDYVNYIPKMWYKPGPPNIYKTFTAPILTVYISRPTLYLAGWEYQPIRIAHIQFMYNFDNNELLCDLHKSEFYCPDTIPPEVVSFREEKLKQLYGSLQFDYDVKSVRKIYKNITSIVDLEFIMEYFKIQLRQNDLVIQGM